MKITLKGCVTDLKLYRLCAILKDDTEGIVSIYKKRPPLILPLLAQQILGHLKL